VGGTGSEKSSSLNRPGLSGSSLTGLLPKRSPFDTSTCFTVCSIAPSGALDHFFQRLRQGARVGEQVVTVAARLVQGETEER
jgi:hypothetical protein